MLVSQKCQYALRAIFELARRVGDRPVKIADIADAQAIPPRFLEVILGQLKQGKFVSSQRGSEGGYRLARQASGLTVGEIVRFVQGPIGPVGCLTADPDQTCPLYGECAFLPMWKKVNSAISSVYDTTTFQDLLDQGSQTVSYVPCYTI